MKFEEIEGDLFAASEEFSLAHCVAADLKMGAGIAVKFKQMFGQVETLKSQNVNSPGVAVLKVNNRYIYYLVTKKTTYQKPTYESLKSSLEKMRANMIDNSVKKLAMPKIGCGIDGLEWSNVSEIIKSVFENDDVHIKVFVFVPK